MVYISEQGQLCSLDFYNAVKAQQPVSVLETLRNMSIFHWEEESEHQTYTPSDALRYAIEFDHRDYAGYLLGKFSDCALAISGEQLCTCPSSALHLTEAIQQGRREIMDLILQVTHEIPTLRSYINRRGCIHMGDGKTPLHVACELSDSHAMTVLLGNGASPQVVDDNEMTPLDLILEQLRTSNVNKGAKWLCLERMLMFMPKLQFKLKNSLKDDRHGWAKVLGEDNYNYLVGKNPATLFLMSMQTVLSHLPPHDITKSLDQLPIPTSLKLLTLPQRKN